MLSARILDAGNTAFSCRNPQPAGVVRIQAPDKSGRDTVVCRESGETACCVSRQAAIIKPDPKIARNVFAKCGRGGFGYIVRCGVAMKTFRRAFPAGQHTVGISQSADPYVAARVFEETKDIT